jgi:hypothetical protein
VDTNTGSAKEHAAEVVGTAKEAAQQQVDDAAEKGRGMLRSQVDQRSTQAGTQAQTLADALRQTAAQLRGDGDQQKARYAGMADQGADRLEHVGGYLTAADADEILVRLEDMARRQPWLVAGAGVLVGIAAARFLKASSTERYYQIRARGRQPAVDAWSPAELPPVELEPATISGRPVGADR